MSFCLFTCVCCFDCSVSVVQLFVGVVSFDSLDHRLLSENVRFRRSILFLTRCKFFLKPLYSAQRFLTCCCRQVLRISICSLPFVCHDHIFFCFFVMRLPSMCSTAFNFFENNLLDVVKPSGKKFQHFNCLWNVKKMAFFAYALGFVSSFVVALQRTTFIIIFSAVVFVLVVKTNKHTILQLNYFRRKAPFKCSICTWTKHNRNKKRR